METTCPPLMPTDSIINRLADALAVYKEIEYNSYYTEEGEEQSLDPLHYGSEYYGLVDATIIFGIGPVLYRTKYGYIVHIGSFEKLVPFTLGE